MNTPEQLSESLLAACKAAGIESPRYIAQDKDEPYVWHYDTKPDTKVSRMWTVYNGICTKIHHPPYAEDWQDSLLEWVDHVVDTNKKVDDAISMEYHERVESDDGSFWSRIDCYRSDWQIALAWKVMAEENLEK